MTGFRLIPVLFLSMFLLVLSGCGKGPLHEDFLVDGNTPPPFDGVSDVTLQTFVNRLYIDLVGRGPTQAELVSASSSLRAAQFSEAALDDLIQDLQQRYEYYKNFDVLTKSRVLNGTDSAQVAYEVFLYDDAIEYYYTIGDTAQALLLEPFREMHEDLRVASFELYHKFIGIDEYMKRHVMNVFYDEINMGSENFVLSCFENLFYREPTSSELSNGINMVDGIFAFLFLQDGSTKLDFVNIAVSAPAFNEGVVMNIYRTLLARPAGSTEMALYVQALEAGDTFLDVQREVIKTEEYAGF